MKTSRIGILPVLLMATGLLFPVSGAGRLESEPSVEVKVKKDETVSLHWTVAENGGEKSFLFKGKEDRPYRVYWGDRTKDTVVGKGTEESVLCAHKYAKKGYYEVRVIGLH
ncbi:MAG: hypothetical protein NC396_02730 [Bacteroides sp.]|nr:hypothetical protein [Bacteroides sp.]MCM1085250.1 hypothetical protein [Bacteroides sp.]